MDKSRNQRIAFMVRTRKISRKKAEILVDEAIKKDLAHNRFLADTNNLFGTSFPVKTAYVSYIPPPVKSIILEYLGPIKTKKELEQELIEDWIHLAEKMRQERVERICAMIPL